MIISTLLALVLAPTVAPSPKPRGGPFTYTVLSEVSTGPDSKKYTLECEQFGQTYKRGSVVSAAKTGLNPYLYYTSDSPYDANGNMKIKGLTTLDAAANRICGTF